MELFSLGLSPVSCRFLLSSEASTVSYDFLKEYPWSVWVLLGLVGLLLCTVILRFILHRRTLKVGDIRQTVSEPTQTPTVKEKNEEEPLRFFSDEENRTSEGAPSPVTAESPSAEEPAEDVSAPYEIRVELIPSYAEEVADRWVLHSELLINGNIPLAEKQDFVPCQPVEVLPIAEPGATKQNFIYYGGFHDGYRQGVKDAAHRS